MKNFIQGMYQKKHFARRLISVILAVIVMGFALSWLVLVNFGTDPCTSMNLAISGRLGMSLGNWQALLNCLLFIIVILWGREYIGWLRQVCIWLRNWELPPTMPSRFCL